MHSFLFFNNLLFFFSFRELYAWEATQVQAIENYQNHRHEMHPVTAKLLDNVLSQ